MNRDQLLQLMESVREGGTTPDAACDRLKNFAFEDLGFAKVDHHRSMRTGMPEVIYCKGKTEAQVAGIFASLTASGVNVLATRASRDQFQAVLHKEPRAVFHDTACCITLSQQAAPARAGRVAIVCGGRAIFQLRKKLV